MCKCGKCIGYGLDEDGEFGDGDDTYDDDEDEDDEEEDDEMLLPFENMKQWVKNKPRGFGEGKVYDTSVEDKLLEEMEQSKQAQTADVNKLQKNPLRPTSMKGAQNKRATEVVPRGARVRVVNLPKKKNIHRDLKSAFLRVPGILDIIPGVSGNSKTRDPVCKGFAFVDFKSKEDATRFIEIFSSRSVMFGKIQKEIKCDIMDLQSPSSAPVQSTVIPCTASEFIVPGLEGDRSTDSSLDASSLDSWEEINSIESEGPDSELVRANVEDIKENLESMSLLKVNGDYGMEVSTDSSTHLFSSKTERVQAPEKNRLAEGKVEKFPERKLHVKAKGEKVPEKKRLAQGKKEKVPKLNVPGSAKRLKIKEKAVLTDVFAKYGIQSALASKEGS
ncbi:hypothetical protein CJ030_MR7G024846 [Morella rubra]|uniref:RRM domain-containing protein n=1 Tax=Morella rubra TaxID=262757 RepID=A0A6A1V4W8_9ROSI|nr:hypothetical protein CJ030_MR7G024846 [Morella rubra]